MSTRHHALLAPLFILVGTLGAGCVGSNCVPWPRMSEVHLEGRQIYPAGWNDVSFPAYNESAKEYRSRLPRLKSHDEINANLAKSRFPNIEEACRFGDEAEKWRDTCPRPADFRGAKGGYPKPLGMGYAWIICDSARDLGLVPGAQKASP